MKKIIKLLAPLFLLLSSCTNNVYEFKSIIYCARQEAYPASGNICRNCENWYNVSKEQLESAYSITCTYVKDHCHYCVTWGK